MSKLSTLAVSNIWPSAMTKSNKLIKFVYFHKIAIPSMLHCEFVIEMTETSKIVLKKQKNPWSLDKHQSCSVKKVFLKISEDSQENTCTRVSILIKLQQSACNFIKKEALEQVFSCEF